MATHKILTLALFDSEAAADTAAAALKDSGVAKHDEIGILALDDDGKIKMDKVGARSTAAGAGVGAVLWLLGPRCRCRCRGRGTARRPSPQGSRPG